jgi:hypothetical protein
MKFEKQEPPLLFDLASDPGEKFNVAKDHPEAVAEIERELEKHRKDLVPGKPQY